MKKKNNKKKKDKSSSDDHEAVLTNGEHDESIRDKNKRKVQNN